MVIGTLSETIGCIGALSDLSEHYRKCSDSRRRLCRGSQLSELSDSHYRTIGEATIGLSELSEYYRSLLSDYRNRAQEHSGVSERSGVKESGCEPIAHRAVLTSAKVGRGVRVTEPCAFLA